MVMTHAGPQLTRLVVLAPGRRLELALPAHLALATMLPAVLRHAGERVADDGGTHGGWLLRRVDGAVLDPAGSLAAQQVRDGEVLVLAPRRDEWPEATYDDIVDAIAGGARGRGRRWSGAATRLAGLAGAGLCAVVAVVTIAAMGPPWTVGAVYALAAAGGLLFAGTAVSRVASDASAGAVVAALGLPLAFLGGLVALAGDEPLGRLGAPHVLAASAILVAAAAAGHLGTADHGRLFVAAGFAGGCGIVAALSAVAWFDGPQAAALVLAVVLLASPMLPALAVRIGRIPLPELPRTPEDLVRDEPQPDRRSVTAATARADETLSGLLIGAAVASVVGLAMLAFAQSTTAHVLAAVVSVAHLLRARFFVGVRHRVPLLVTGAAGLALLATGLGTRSGFAVAVLPVVLGLLAVSVAAGLYYTRRHPAPRLGRLADLLDVALTLAVVPLATAVFGLIAYMRGIGG